MAKDGGCFLVERPGGKWLLYRTTPTRNVYIGHASSPPSVRRMVARATGYA